MIPAGTESSGLETFRSDVANEAEELASGPYMAAGDRFCRSRTERISMEVLRALSPEQVP
jgi:hypothetical protein